MSKKNESIFLLVISFCCMSVLLTTFVLTWFGVIDLRIVGQTYIDPWIEYVGAFIMFSINIFFLSSISTNVFDRKILYPCSINAFIWVLMFFSGAGQNLIFTAFIPIVCITLFSFAYYRRLLTKKLVQNILAQILITNILIPAYQQLSGFVKLGNMNFSFYRCNILTAFIYSIDLYLVYMFMYWVVKKHGWTLESMVRWAELARKACREILTNREMEDVSELTGRQRRIFYFLAWAYLTLQSLMIISVNTLINKFFYYLGGFYIGAIELTISWAALELCRLALGRTYHAPPAKCNTVSLLTFFGLSRLGLPLHISLFFNIGLSAGLAYVLHILVLRDDSYKQLLVEKKAREDFKAKTRRGRAAVTLETLPPEHIDYQLLCDYANGETLEILADKHNLSFSTVNRKINALTQK